MCNYDIISLKHKIISGDLANSIGHSFFSPLFFEFLLATCWIKLFCHIQEVLAGCSWGGSYVVLCIHLGSWLLINSFASKKSKSMGRGVSYHLPFAFTFAPLQISYMWPDQKCWHGPNYYFSSKWHWSATIIDIKPKENSSVQSRLDSFTFIISVNFFPFTCFMLKEVYLFVSKDFDDDFEQNPPQNFMHRR